MRLCDSLSLISCSPHNYSLLPRRQETTFIYLPICVRRTRAGSHGPEAEPVPTALTLTLFYPHLFPSSQSLAAVAAIRLSCQHCQEDRRCEHNFITDQISPIHWPGQIESNIKDKARQTAVENLSRSVCGCYFYSRKEWWSLDRIPNGMKRHWSGGMGS